MITGVGRDVNARYARRHRQYLEYAVVVVLACLVAMALLARLEHLNGHVETLTLEAQIDAMRTAVTLVSVTGRDRPTPGSNPVALLAEAPAGYQGEVERLNIDSVAPGTWVFGRDVGRLAYRARYGSTRLPGAMSGRAFSVRIVSGKEEMERMRLDVQPEQG